MQGFQTLQKFSASEYYALVKLCEESSSTSISLNSNRNGISGVGKYDKERVSRKEEKISAMISRVRFHKYWNTNIWRMEVIDCNTPRWKTHLPYCSNPLPRSLLRSRGLLRLKHIIILDRNMSGIKKIYHPVRWNREGFVAFGKGIHGRGKKWDFRNCFGIRALWTEFFKMEEILYRISLI